jgi:plasmid stabilization system protein ParE
MTYRGLFSEAAASDLAQLFDFALQRELDSETGDLDIPAKAVQAIKDSVVFLTRSPFACRKAGGSSFIRELIIPFGHTGYVALLEIVDKHTAIIGAIRHQREDDCH